MYQVVVKEKDNIMIQTITDIQELEKVLPKEYEEVNVKKVEDEKTK